MVGVEMVGVAGAGLVVGDRGLPSLLPACLTTHRPSDANCGPVPEAFK